MLADPAADHDQVGCEQLLHRPVVDGEALGPLGIGEVLVLLGRVSGAGLGVVAVDLEVTELGVRDQHAVVDERRPDPGAEGGHDDQPGSARGCAVPHLGQSRRVRVVEDVYVAAGRVGEEAVGVGTDPGLVDVRGRADLAAAHDTRDGDTHRARGVRETVEQLDERVRHRLGCGGLRRLDPQAVGRELAGLQVDGRALDARAAEVDAEGE